MKQKEVLRAERSLSTLCGYPTKSRVEPAVLAREIPVVDGSMALDAPACRIHPSMTTTTKWEVINNLFVLFNRALHALFSLASTAPRPPRPR
jgi:hypothetical protein